jgi:protein-S-isoprenylcysteine O-methyltransferase Ste14
MEGCLILLGEALWFQSLALVIYTVGTFGFFHVRVLIEENVLADKFGTPYEQYCQAVPRWIPRRRHRER